MFNDEYKNIKPGDKIQIRSKAELDDGILSKTDIIFNYAEQIFTIDKIREDNELVLYTVKELPHIELVDADFINISYRKEKNATQINTPKS